MLPCLKFNLILLFLLFLTSCHSTVKTIQKPEIAYGDVLNTSIYVANVYIGISGRMKTHEKEIDYAKLHIAHQIAMRDKCVVDEGMVSIYGEENNFTTYDSNFDYDDSCIDELMSDIEIIETYTFPELVVVIAKDSKRPAEANAFIPRVEKERPRWVNNPGWVRSLPELEGYFVGVGISDRYTLLYKGFLVADVKAAQEIAKEKQSFAQHYLLDRVNNVGTQLKTGIIALTQAELEGFYVLDRWIEPDKSICYSLGIARKF